MIPKHIKDDISRKSHSLFPIQISGLMPDDIQKMAIEQNKKSAVFMDAAEYGYSLAEKELEEKDGRIAALVEGLEDCLNLLSLPSNAITREEKVELQSLINKHKQP